jgi:small subunit ribosomal protein S9
MSEDQITTNAIESTDTAVIDAPPVETQPAPAPVPAVEAKNGFWWGTGRRKTAVARVRIRAGKGGFMINGRQVDVHFTEMRDRNDAVAPLKATKTFGTLDVLVKVHGGGFTGQAGAVQLGLARALKDYDGSLEPILRDNDMLTRDDRKVERKKPGQPGARKRFQFSKR